MLSKTNLIATLVTGIWSFFGGYLLWGFLVDPFLKEHSASTDLVKETPDFLFLVIGCLLSAFAFCTIYSKWARGYHKTSSGLNFGLWIGIFTGFGSGIISYATANMLDLTGTMINGVTYIVFFVVMGMLASFVYDKVKSSEE